MSDGPFDKAPTGDSSRTIPLNPLPAEVDAALATYRAALIDGADVFAAGERLRAAIRTACVAAERRGIERAADLCEHYGDVAAEDHEAGACYRLRELLLALPVPESTEAP